MAADLRLASAGNLGLITLTGMIEKDFEERTVDGVKMVLQNTPGYGGAG